MSNIINSLQTSCYYDELFHINKAEDRKFFLYGEIPSMHEYDCHVDICSALGITERILHINEEDVNISDPTKRKPIYIYINSVGGDIHNGFALVAAIEASKTPVYTVNIGMWASMAFYIGIAGHKRFSLQHMTFLLHEGYSGIIGATHQVQDKATFDKKYEEGVVRSHVLKHSKLDSKQYEEIATREFYMLPSEAKKLGFIDKIVDSLDVIV